MANVKRTCTVSISIYSVSIKQ